MATMNDELLLRLSIEVMYECAQKIDYLLFTKMVAEIETINLYIDDILRGF